MNPLGRIEVFVEVAKQQSFAKAAKTIGITGPAASKQIMALEAELGVKLLNRTTRLVTLTDEGHAYYDRVRIAVEELKDAATQIQDQKSAPRGTLRINAPQSFSRLHLLPVLAGFAKKYPDVICEITFDDRMVDIIADGFDIVIRIGIAHDSNLVAKHLGDSPAYIVASPAYLRQYGMPKTLGDLKNHRIIAYTHHGAVTEWKFKDGNNKTHAFRSSGAFRTDNAELMTQAALDGVGIAPLPGFCCATHIKAGKLVHVMKDYTLTPPRQILALMPPNRYRATKVKLFLDWLSAACRSMPLD